MSYRILAQNTNILRVISSDFIYCITPQIHIEVEKVPTGDHFKRSRRDPPNPLRFLRENRCPMQPLMSHNDPISPLLSPFIPLAAGFPESKMVKMALSPQLSYHAAQCCMPPPPHFSYPNDQGGHTRGAQACIKICSATQSYP